MAANKPTTTERDDEIVTARYWCPRGTTIYAVPRHIDRAGNLQLVSFFIVKAELTIGCPGMVCLDFKVAAILRRQRNRKRGGVEVSDLDGDAIRDRAVKLVRDLGAELHGDALAFHFVCF